MHSGYAFERYNGILGNFPTNQKSIEPQLMRKCLMLHSHSFPHEREFLKSINQTLSGGLLSATKGDKLANYVQISAPVLCDMVDFKLTGKEKLLPPVKQIVFDSDTASFLKMYIRVMVPRYCISYLPSLCYTVIKSIIC